MSYWIDKVTLYCDECENSREVSVNLERWCLDDLELPMGWDVRGKGTDEQVFCPSCVEQEKHDHLCDVHADALYEKECGMREGTYVS